MRDMADGVSPPKRILYEAHQFGAFGQFGVATLAVCVVVVVVCSAGAD